MRVSLIFPRDGIRNDPVAIRDFAQTAESLGYDSVSCSDHVIGRHGLMDSGRPVIDPFVSLSYISASAPSLGLTAGVMVLPQRQTVLFAKQAAGLDLLCGGKLQLNLAAGWNALEYETLNENFSNRGRRMSEQIEVLRALWTSDDVDFTGRYHRIDHAGINPMPVQRPIPIWLAGAADSALRRVARYAEGWIPQNPPGHQGTTTPDSVMPMLDKLQTQLIEEKRDRAKFGLLGSVGLSAGNPDSWRNEIDGWRGIGATQLQISTGREPIPPEQHIALARGFAESGLLEEYRAAS